MIQNVEHISKTQKIHKFRYHLFNVVIYFIFQSIPFSQPSNSISINRKVVSFWTRTRLIIQKINLKWNDLNSSESHIDDEN